MLDGGSGRIVHTEHGYETDGRSNKSNGIEVIDLDANANGKNEILQRKTSSEMKNDEKKRKRLNANGMKSENGANYVVHPWLDNTLSKLDAKRMKSAKQKHDSIGNLDANPIHSETVRVILENSEQEQQQQQERIHSKSQSGKEFENAQLDLNGMESENNGNEDDIDEIWKLADQEFDEGIEEFQDFSWNSKNFDSQTVHLDTLQPSTQTNNRPKTIPQQNPLSSQRYTPDTHDLFSNTLSPFLDSILHPLPARVNATSNSVNATGLVDIFQLEKELNATVQETPEENTEKGIILRLQSVLQTHFRRTVLIKDYVLERWTNEEMITQSKLGLRFRKQVIKQALAVFLFDVPLNTLEDQIKNISQKERELKYSAQDDALDALFNAKTDQVVEDKKTWKVLLSMRDELSGLGRWLIDWYVHKRYGSIKKAVQVLVDLPYDEESVERLKRMVRAVSELKLMFETRLEEVEDGKLSRKDRFLLKNTYDAVQSLEKILQEYSRIKKDRKSAVAKSFGDGKDGKKIGIKAISDAEDTEMKLKKSSIGKLASDRDLFGDSLRKTVRNVERLRANDLKKKKAKESRTVDKFLSGTITNGGFIEDETGNENQFRKDSEPEFRIPKISATSKQNLLTARQDYLSSHNNEDEEFVESKKKRVEFSTPLYTFVEIDSLAQRRKLLAEFEIENAREDSREYQEENEEWDESDNLFLDQLKTRNLTHAKADEVDPRLDRNRYSMFGSSSASLIMSEQEIQHAVASMKQEIEWTTPPRRYVSEYFFEEYTGLHSLTRFFNTKAPEKDRGFPFEVLWESKDHGVIIEPDESTEEDQDAGIDAVREQPVHEEVQIDEGWNSVDGGWDSIGASREMNTEIVQRNERIRSKTDKRRVQRERNKRKKCRFYNAITQTGCTRMFNCKYSHT